MFEDLKILVLELPPQPFGKKILHLMQQLRSLIHGQNRFAWTKRWMKGTELNGFALMSFFGD